MTKERTLILVKPNGVRRRLVGQILAYFERDGFDIIAIKGTWPTAELASEHYH